MNCPSCRNCLHTLDIIKVQLHVCEKGCGGLWFNRIAIKKIRSLPDNAGQGLLTIGNTDGIRSFRDVEHICPQCQTTLLFRHFFCKEHDLEVDQCSKCGGLWIDFCRKHFFRSQPDCDRKPYLEKWRELKITLKYKLDQMEQTHPDMLEAKEQIKHIFRFISPSDG